jgi:cytochrome c peroxidase
VEDPLAELDLPETPYDYATLDLPAHLMTNSLLGPNQEAAVDHDNEPGDNPLTDDGATLGRVLFYDKNLSANGTISCASCHQQEHGFSDPKVLSEGYESHSTRRHSMGLINARFYNRGRFFWDERAATLEEQVLMPIQDSVEMGMTLATLVSAVENQPYYPILFENAFGDDQITADRISKALAQFIRSIVSTQSRYDIVRVTETNPEQLFADFTASENRGKALFMRPVPLGGGGCIGCHASEAFINPDPGATNNGLDLASTDDLGVYEAIPAPQFLGAFKVPSLKNIELTAPYMHDGRFATLEEVINHYSEGIKAHPNLAPALRDPQGNPVKINFTDQEKADLLAFLKTLTDRTIATEAKWSDPF